MGSSPWGHTGLDMTERLSAYPVGRCACCRQGSPETGEEAVAPVRRSASYTIALLAALHQDSETSFYSPTVDISLGSL